MRNPKTMSSISTPVAGMAMDIDRGINDHGRIAASDGELGHGEKDGPTLHKVPHCPACAK